MGVPALHDPTAPVQPPSVPAILESAQVPAGGQQVGEGVSTQPLAQPQPQPQPTSVMTTMPVSTNGEVKQQLVEKKSEEPAVKRSKPTPPCPQCRAGVPGHWGHLRQA